MKSHTRKAEAGFSLVELLAVVLILAVLAAVAIPLYTNTRRASAARACKANIAAIASAQSAFALRNGEYAVDPNMAYDSANPTAGGLVGGPEGLSAPVTCPLDGGNYAFTGGGPDQPFNITCPNAPLHEAVVPSTPAGTDNYSRDMAAPAPENIP